MAPRSSVEPSGRYTYKHELVALSRLQVRGASSSPVVISARVDRVDLFFELRSSYRSLTPSFRYEQSVLKTDFLVIKAAC